MATKTKQGNFTYLRKQAYRVAVGAAILALGAGTCTAIVRAVSCSSISECNSKISNLNDKNSASRAEVDKLEHKASSYSAAIARLRSQISGIQSNIDKNEAKQEALQKKIDELQQKITYEKSVLGEVIRKMYVNGGMSNIEMLATSDNLSQYVDKQEYRNVIQQKIQSTLDQITKLQAQVKSKKSRIDDLLKDLSSQRKQLDAAKAQQARLLSYNQAQQASYNAKIQSNNSDIAHLKELRHAQIIANEQLSGGGGRVIAGDPSHGGYPTYLANAPKDSLVDPWGMYNRECVSYTAWKVKQTFGYMPYWGGVGNANEWPGDARNYGIPTGSTPKVHSVAIWNVGYWGHAMWVEAVNPDGSIWVSQYNYDFQGHYSEMRVDPVMARSLTYIYFH